MFYLSNEKIDIDFYKNKLRFTSCGAFCSFEGWVRNNNENLAVKNLIYTGYEELAINTGRVILLNAKANFDIKQAICVHRLGNLEIGDLAVWIGVSSAHRDASFAACKYIIDTIKKDVPIWKEEFYTQSEEKKWLANKV